MAKVSVTFELDNVSWEHVRFELAVKGKTSLGNFTPIANSVVDAFVVVSPPPAANILTNQTPVVS